MQELNQFLHSQRARLSEEKKGSSMLIEIMRNIGKRCFSRNIASSSMDIHVLRHSLDAVNDIVKKNINVANKEIF